MNEPKLTIALAERGDRPVLLISRNDSAPINFIDFDLARLAELGHVGACVQLGELALTMLHAAHPQVFAPYPSLAPAEGPLARPDDAVRYLVHRSVLDRTRAYVTAIDAILQREADELAGTSLAEGWQEMRARILRDYPD